MASEQATVAEEEYLQILFWLQEAALPMTGANVARAMQLSAPTVHEMVGRLERFLTDVLGVPWDEVHEEAERLEHAMSPVLEERMYAAIGDAKTCPHGHPIRAGQRIEGVPLADAGEGARVTILRFENEAEDLLHYLKATGLEPGLEGTITATGGDEVAVTGVDGHVRVLDATVAQTVSVLADPSPPPRVALPDQLVFAKERYGR